MVDTPSPTPSQVTTEAVVTGAVRAAVCAAVRAVRADGPEVDLSEVINALGVLAGHRTEPVLALSWELARVCAALDARLDGYGIGERPLADDATQVWVAAAADAMVAALGVFLEGRDPAGFLTEVFDRIDATFGAPKRLPAWRTELRDAFCDPDVPADGAVLIAGDQDGLWEMLLCVEYARAGSFDEICAALAAAGDGTTIAEFGPSLVAWFAVPHLAVLAEASAAESDPADPEAALAAAFEFFDATEAGLAG